MEAIPPLRLRLKSCSCKTNELYPAVSYTIERDSLFDHLSKSASMLAASIYARQA